MNYNPRFHCKICLSCVYHHIDRILCMHKTVYMYGQAQDLRCEALWGRTTLRTVWSWPPRSDTYYLVTFFPAYVWGKVRNRQSIPPLYLVPVDLANLKKHIIATVTALVWAVMDYWLNVSFIKHLSFYLKIFKIS